jgi:hypothetical protein
MLLIASALCMIEQGNQADSATTQFQSFHTLLVSVLMSAPRESVFDPRPRRPGSLLITGTQ